MFFTTLTFVRAPMASWPSLRVSALRTSSLTDAQNFNDRPPGVVSGLPNITPIFSRSWLMKTTEVLVLLM